MESKSIWSTNSHARFRINQHFIDSLDPLITHQGYAYTCQVLHHLYQRSENTKIVALLHKGEHKAKDICMVKYMIPTTISVKHEQDTTSLLCHLSHRKKNGKIVINHQTLTFEKDGHAHLTDIKSKSYQLEVKEHEADPAANLTFNLKLNESEKIARRDLVLPYLKSHTDTKEPDIFYELDELDDFDEEDPDDDLDI